MKIRSPFYPWNISLEYQWLNPVPTRLRILSYSYHSDKKYPRQVGIGRAQRAKISNPALQH